MRPDMERALRQRSLDQQRVNDMTAATTSVPHFVTIQGPGEALHDVPFPVLFTEKPVLSYAFDLDRGQTLQRGNFPILSAGVHYFEEQQIVPGTTYYSGARCIIVATGHAGMRMTVHLRFEGIALVNPLTPAAGI